MKLSFKLIGLMTLTATTVLAGSLDPPSAPGNASSGMYSIQSLCDRLQTGAVGSQNLFTEPTSGPGATGCTLNDVMTKAPAPDNTNGATPAEVATGKKFWGLKSGSWGLQTGTASGGGSAAVPKTGQTICYDASGQTGNTTTCTGTGEDGAFQKGVAWPSPRFTDNSNGTVTDNLTGLIWLKNANCMGAIVGSDWATALTYVASLNSAGTMNSNNCGDTSNSASHQTDWRLPNAKELYSLIDLSESFPALPTSHPFTSVQNDYYWSASSYAYATTFAWVVNLFDGNVYAYDKTNTFYVWPVRGGQ